MKKVTLTFVVSDEVAANVRNELSWGELGNAASILNNSCEESDYEISPIIRPTYSQMRSHLGIKYKVYLEKEGCKPYFIMNYAESEEAVRARFDELLGESGWHVTKVKEA